MHLFRRLTCRPSAGLLAVAVAVGVALLTASCATDDQPVTTPPSPPPTEAPVAPVAGARSGGRAAYGIGAEPVTLNPTTSLWAQADQAVARALFDTLTAFAADGTAQPNLAASITPNADHTVWTIGLRAGVVLHDGTPVTAGLVAEGLDAFRAAPLTGPTLAPIAAVEAVDDATVSVTMARPWATFPQTLTGQVGVVADPGWLRSGEARNPVGTGPFSLGSWVPGASITAKANRSYWRVDDEGTPLPYLDELVLRFIPDDGVRAATLRAGAIDAMTTASADQVTWLAEWAEDDELQVVTGLPQRQSTTFVQLNTAATPFDHPLARRAVALATDNEAFADDLGDKLVTPASGLFDPSSPWSAPTAQPAFDPGAAEALVRQIEAGGAPLSFEVLTGTDARSLTAVQHLQDQWREAGIETRIRVVDEPELMSRLISGGYQAAIWGELAPVDPAEQAPAWLPQAATPIGQPSLNLTRVDDPSLGAALDAASAAADRAPQHLLYAEAQRLLGAELAYLWLSHTPFAVATAPGLAGVVATTLPGGAPALLAPGGALSLAQAWRRA